MQAVEQEVRRFIVDNLLFGEEHQALGGDESFLERGIIDSTGVLELVAFVESRFSIKVKDAELIPDNLDTVNNLVRFIGRKTGAA